MRRALRQIGAIIAILFILFMNVGSFALQAHAAGDWDAPKWDAPKWDAPTWDAPTWEVEEWESPDWELSEWKATEWKSPEWELSEWKAPEWNGSEWVVPNLNSPMHQGGNGKQESVNDNVNIDDPESSVKLPDGTTIPTDKEGPTHPTLDKIVPQPEEPFFTIDGPTPYSGGKLAKDIAKETINFVDKVLKNQDDIDYDPLKDFGKSGKNMIYSGFKTFTKGDTTLETGAQVYDFVKGAKNLKGKYDTYKEFIDIKRLKDAGDVAASLQKYDDLVRAGKTFTPANAIVSAITLPFTVKDTYDNVNKLKNASTAEEKRNTRWDLAGNAGELLTGTAAFVALVPGGQPIAAGMVVVGGVLVLASSAHKLIRNRKEIVADLKKKGKAIADGAKKTWGKITSIFK
ncbi:hypothetical protein [Sporosarcina sp. FSL K6-3457]|uniref:hypothetical protein n=1 Tax=Sporosarcina sp. FSL K6-3457 TaxID=2978204 RepID=UPI0030F90CE4